MMNENNNNDWSLKQKLYPCGFRHDALTLAGQTFAFVISYVFSSWMITTVSLAFIGRLGQTELNGSALALTVYGLIGNSIMVGLNFGCDTLLPQCSGGNKHKMGLILQRAIIIAGYACLIVWTLMLNAKYLLKWIEHDQNVLAVTNKFLQYYLLVVPFDALSLILRMYIASTGRTRALIYMNAISNAVNVLSHYICLYQFHMDIRAAPVSITIAYASLVITAILYIRYSPIYEETWHPVTRDCLQEWSIYLKLALPGVISIIVECWSIELSVFFAARLGARSLSAQVVVQQIVLLLYLIMASIGNAGNILIGQYLGANKPVEAINAKNITYTIGGILLMFNVLMILLSHHWLPFLFNIETGAVPLTRQVLLLSAIVNIFDGLNVLQTSIVTACGMQRYSAIFLFIGFYLLGLPLAYIFMFIIHMDIFGFWFGMIIGETLTNTLLFILIWRFDWTTFSKNAFDHIQSAVPSTNENKYVELLRRTSATESIRTVTEVDAIQIESGNNKTIFIRTITDKVFKNSIVVKVLVLILFFSMFIVSFINSVQ